MSEMICGECTVLLHVWEKKTNLECAVKINDCTFFYSNHTLLVHLCTFAEQHATEDFLSMRPGKRKKKILRKIVFICTCEYRKIDHAVLQTAPQLTKIFEGNMVSLPQIKSNNWIRKMAAGSSGI